MIMNSYLEYRKNPNNSDTRKTAVIIIKFEQCGSTIMSPNNTNGMANSVDPDQTALLGAV